MAFPVKQNPLDWITQQWNIFSGKRLDPIKDDWLMGPIGSIGGIADRFVDQLAEDEGLEIQRDLPGTGLIDGFASFGVTVNPKIEDFYTRATEYDLDVWTQWRPVFGSFGYVVDRLFSQRIQQLNLPQNSLDTAYGLKSEIISLLDSNGQLRYRVWYRRLKKNGKVVYSGVYSQCTLPSGERCLKVVFPLPEGSATVILRVTVDTNGNLELFSKGKQSGDPGFYFIVKDRKGQFWKNYLPSFHERIFVYEDNEACLRADHSMSLYGCKAYELHYKMLRKEPFD